MRNCEMTAHVTTKLNRSHLVHGQQALILPCLGRTEIDTQETGPQGVTVEDSMSMVHVSYGMNKPASPQLLSEPAIVARLAHAFGLARTADTNPGRAGGIVLTLLVIVVASIALLVIVARKIFV